METTQHSEQQLKFWWENLNDWWKTTFKQYIFRIYRNDAQSRDNNLTNEEIQKILKLQSINLWGEINSLEPLRKLTDLKKIVCMDDDLAISDLEPIRGLKNLETVNIVGTRVDNLEPLSELKNLRELYCFRTNVKTIKPLMDLNKIELLWIGNQAPSQEIREFKLKHPNCKINPK